MTHRVTIEKRIWRAVTQLEELFLYALYGFSAFWKVDDISDITYKRVLQRTGYDIKGYSLQLTTDQLKHFLYSHFTETRPDQRDIKFEDIANRDCCQSIYFSKTWE